MGNALLTLGTRPCSLGEYLYHGIRMLRRNHSNASSGTVELVYCGLSLLLTVYGIASPRRVLGHYSLYPLSSALFV